MHVPTAPTSGDMSEWHTAIHLTGRAALYLALVTAGCEHRLPSAPSELQRGIVVYEDANYLGVSALIVEDVTDLREFTTGPCVHEHSDLLAGNYTTRDWNDCISSVRVAPGWSATLYRDDGYRDDSITISDDVPNLQLVDHDCPHGGLNDCVTSIRVRQLR